MDGEERGSEAHLSHTHLHLGVGSDSGGAEEETDGWVSSPYCISRTVDRAATLRAYTIYSLLRFKHRTIH